VNILTELLVGEAGEPCPEVRLSQDRMLIDPLTLQQSWVRGKGRRQIRSRISRWLLMDSLYL